MSIANDKVVTMNILEKSEELSEFFLPVFEDYWLDGGKQFDGDVVEFCLVSHNLSFQLAFQYAHGLIKRDGLTDKGIDYINEAHEIMLEGISNGTK